MEENNNINIDPSQIEKILSVMKLVNNMNNISNDSNNANNGEYESDASTEKVESKNLPSNEIVQKMDGNTALIRIKEAIPFLDMPYQKNIGLMVKLMEMEKLVNNFKTMSVSGDNNNKLKKQMLMAIRPELDGRKRQMVDVFVKVMEISDIVEGLRSNE